MHNKRLVSSYSRSAYEQMRDRIKEREEKKKANKVPYKTILAGF